MTFFPRLQIFSYVEDRDMKCQSYNISVVREIHNAFFINRVATLPAQVGNSGRSGLTATSFRL